jgi:hypothetical protein
LFGSVSENGVFDRDFPFVRCELVCAFALVTVNRITRISDEMMQFMMSTLFTKTCSHS